MLRKTELARSYSPALSDCVSAALLAARAGGRGGLGSRAQLHREQLRVRPAPGEVMMMR